MSSEHALPPSSRIIIPTRAEMLEVGIKPYDGLQAATKADLEKYGSPLAASITASQRALLTFRTPLYVERGSK